MRKFILILTIISLVAILSACATISNSTNGSAPEIHTMPPTEQSEVEWCPVEDCDLSFADENGETYFNENDIKQFALVGSDHDAILRFVLSDDAKEMISSLPTPDTFTVVLNEKEVGSAKLSEDKTELTISELSFEQMCSIADTIRGF